MVHGIEITGTIKEVDEKINHVAVVELVQRGAQGVTGREWAVEAEVR